VRLGGLYALERLAQNHSDHRQTIVNVICAYLRMPYTPPNPPSADQPESASTQPSPAVATAPTEPTTEPPDIPAAELAPGRPDPHEERQVRLTAQRILGDHLRDQRPADQRRTLPPDLKFWQDMDLDLTGATLIDLDFNQCRGRQVSFATATFTADAWFSGATFTGAAVFSGATFTGAAGFDRATFTRDAVFSEAIFTGEVVFSGATFTGDAGFSRATFTADAWFGGATFTRNAWFGQATFTADAWFNGATFTGAAVFNGATFTGDAGFSEAIFTGEVVFSGATFTGDAGFSEATFTGAAQFHQATFQRGPDRLDLYGARVRDLARKHVWPPGWTMQPNEDGTTATLTRVGPSLPA
jgi:uncharacterized protein YjbI with pentapeptide repeats